MTAPTPPVWTDDRIREAFIYDGGEAEYHDPISGAQTQRRVAGSIFDAWLAAHDTALLATVPTPPADDVREALIEGVKLEARNLMRSDARVWHEALESALDKTLPGFWATATQVRPHGTVTDAEVDSRLRAALAGYLDLRTVARVMADLDAAREVHP